jgi:formylglycine-generating enzyme
MLSGAAFSQSEMQVVGRFAIDRTEVRIAQFQKFVDATKFLSAAERTSGGSTYESSWAQRKGWTWRAPSGKTGTANEPAVHINDGKAQNIYKRPNLSLSNR